MRRYLNTDTLNVQARPDFNAAIGTLEDKRGNTPPLAVQYTNNNGVIQELDFPTAFASFKFGAKIHDDFLGDYVVSNWDAIAGAFTYTKTGGSKFTDAATTSGSAILASAKALFSATDVGLGISGAGIPANTTILSVQGVSSITLSANATETNAGVTIVITGRKFGASISDPVYTVNPGLNTVELGDALVDGVITAKPANQAARYALPDLALGIIVRQVDTQSYWIVIDPTKLTEAAGWSSDVPQKEFVDLDGEWEWETGADIASCLTFTYRIWNDVNKGTEGVPTQATPAYPSPGAMALRSFFQTMALGNAVDTGVIDYTAMALSAPPSFIAIFDVRKHAPADSNIYGAIVASTITNTTANFELNAPTDNGSRLLTYIVIP